MLLLQLLVSASATSNHLAAKFVDRGIPLTEICGSTLATKGDRAAHIEGLNNCCVWAKSIAPTPLAPPAAAITVPDRAGPRKVVLCSRFITATLSASEAPPQATGPPLPV